MARFNETLKKLRNLTTNLAGGKAYRLTAEAELATTVLASFVETKFYESQSQGVQRIVRLMNQLPDLRFAAQLAWFARHEHGMRSVSHLLAGYLPVAANKRGLSSEVYGGKAFFRAVVRRVDDCGEILAAYRSFAGENAPIPSAMKKGLASALAEFTPYQLAKYRGAGRTWKLIDVVNILHVRPNDSNREAFAALMRDELISTDTWESKLSRAGQVENVEEMKGQVWSDLLREDKLGHFALLRNLRNIALQSDDATFSLALERLVSRDRITSSLVLPFRYFGAAKELSESVMSGAKQGRARRALQGISTAMEISLANVPQLQGRTLVAVDRSGSMDQTISGRSRIRMAEIASLFAAAVAKRSNADLMIFGDVAKYVPFNPADTLATLTDLLANRVNSPGLLEVGHGTNFVSVFGRAIETEPYDRIILFSDMQSWMETMYNNQSSKVGYDVYRTKTGQNPTFFSVDLAGYGTTLMPQQSVHLLAGWSERVFDVMGMLEDGGDGLIELIRGVRIGN